ncbi:transporter [Rufibacter roseus]|uniref:Transporter n=1 Tax=Rufibacter roseus TaxID=1567108 RepID=A0ABW2DN94_9BACT|nr:transporter [Rufibacter roseus]
MKPFILILFFFLLTSTSWACDVCNLYEFRPVDAKNFVGIFYRHSSFQGYQDLSLERPSISTSGAVAAKNKSKGSAGANRRHVPDGSEKYQVWPSEKDYEHYQTWEFRANFRIKNRINVQAVLPYRVIDIYYQSVFEFPQPVRDSLTTLSGFGDALVTADYMLYGQTGKLRHIWRPGLGVKLPTGSYKITAPNGERYDGEIQPGTSAWGFLLKGTYTLVWDNRFGVDNSISHQFFTNGTNDYEFGDQFNAASSLFYVWRKGNWQLIPRGGAYVEAADRSKENGARIKTTGGHTLFGTAGADAVFKKVTLTASCFQPLADRLNTPQQINNAVRYQVGAFYSF